MKVRELQAKLADFDQDKNVMILDNWNGGGCPREINVGPAYRKVMQEHADNAADCEDLVGQYVVILGYGSY